MLHIERVKEIISTLMQDGTVKVADLAEKYNVNPSTIRRDLKTIAETHDVKLVYGGAYFKKKIDNEGVIELNLATKQTINLEEKIIIAKKAASLIKDGDTIILSSGSTAELMLDYIGTFNSISLITQSLSIAIKAANMPFINLYLPGGKYRGFSGMFYGDLSVQVIQELSANKIFLGSMGVCINHGLTHPIIEEIPVLKALLNISQEKYLIADSSKFGRVSLGKIAEITAFNGIITDDNLPELYREYAEINDIDIL